MPTFFPGLTDFLHPPSFIHSPLSLRCHNRRVSGLFSHKCHVLIMYTLHREPSMLCYRLASALLFSSRIMWWSRAPVADMENSCQMLPCRAPRQRSGQALACHHYSRDPGFTSRVGPSGCGTCLQRWPADFFSPATLFTSLFIRSSLRRTSLSLGQACAFQSNGPK